MIILKNISEVRKQIAKIKRENKSIGYVPTMGALHEGHISLVKESKKESDYTVMSIFVNPIQFGPNEDFKKYPRDLQKDASMAEKAGVDLIFAPEPEEILGNDLLTFVDVNKLQNNLCGVKRPGHFRGVCTIVTKFFNIINPDMAFFGKKDIQQLYIIKKMTKDLNFDINIVPCDIVRDKDGLALSSRNVYLSDEERLEALCLSRSLKIAIDEINNGQKEAKKIIFKIEDNIKRVKTARIDYVKIVNENMEDVESVTNGNIIALAVFIGKTRLIDNHIIGEKLCF
jgi:pantoate--beta-alanine ligase